MKRNLTFICLIVAFRCGTALSQEDSGPVQGRTATSLMRATSANDGTANNRLVESAMAHSVIVTPANPMPGANAANSALIGLLRKQSMAAQSLLVGTARPVATNGGGTLMSGGGKQMLNSQPMTTQGSAPHIGAGQTMNSPGSGSSGVSNARPVPITMQQVPSAVVPARVPQPLKPGTNVIPTQACMVGIAAVDGQKSGVWFSPVSGADGMFVIQGCGFGATPGQVYLSGLHYASTPVTSATLGVMGSPLNPGQITFQVSAGNWSDRQIIAQIDPNASGFFDTNNVTLVLKTATGQLYQAAGFNFSAARADQMLTAILKAPSCWSSQNGCIPAGINLASVNSVNGQIQADAESPSLSLIKPGETIAVARQSSAGQFPIPAASGFAFPGATDTYQFHFAAGFELDPNSGVQLRHTTLDSSYCQSVNGVPSTSGNWTVNYTSTSSFQVSWAEDGCWPKAPMNSASTQQWLDYGSVSAYALAITVLGPRGVNPWASGNSNVLTIQKHPQLLTH
ncbi:MAG TPA: hypothetical protein VGL74_01340 [Terriglobales bacterium]